MDSFNVIFKSSNAEEIIFVFVLLACNNYTFIFVFWQIIVNKIKDCMRND